MFLIHWICEIEIFVGKIEPSVMDNRTLGTTGNYTLVEWRIDLAGSTAALFSVSGDLQPVFLAEKAAFSLPLHNLIPSTHYHMVIRPQWRGTFGYYAINDVITASSQPQNSVD